LFWACFIALIATAFGFIVRTQIIGDWGVQFNLSETQKGEILGVGFWPFAISIVLFSLVIDQIGYGTAMVFAFSCHVISAITTIFATGYTMLYIGTFILALGNGTVEAVINPVVATLYHKDKTKWLNILHAGWPGGMVIGGVLALILGPETNWKWKVALVLIPTAVYGWMMFKRTFPVHERVVAGIPYKDMLKEVGAAGWLIVIYMIIMEINRLVNLDLLLDTKYFDLPHWSLTVLIILLTLIYFFYTRSLGRPLFILMLFIMLPLATTELGTDSWITELVTPVMATIGWQAGWVLIYTAFIMMILRFSAGPIVHKFSPLGLLAICSVIAILGLLFLSKAAGLMIFVAATVYGLGKTFFWPTMLGVAAERFPKGGALTLNAISGVGMLSVGVIGAAFLGNIQDKQIDQELYRQNPGIHAQVVGEEKTSVFGLYKSLDQKKVENLKESDKKIITGVQATAKKSALATVAVFPALMLICYLMLIFYFKARGGYRAVELSRE
jgi:MFS family permease